MIRLLRCLLLAAPALCLAGGAPAQERSWVKARGDFLKAWGSARKPEERKNAIYDHLEGQDRPEMVKLLARAVLLDEDEAAMVIQGAIDILGDLRAEASVAELVRLSSKGHDVVRARMIEALGYCGVEAAVARLREAIDDRSLRVRVAAAAALGRTKDVSVVPRLADALSAEEWPLRAAATWALGRTKSEGAVPHLIAALGRETEIREGIADVLVRLAKTRAPGLSFDAWKRWWEKKGFELDVDRLTIVADPVRPTVVYHGIPTWSRRVVFVFDVSKSMRDEIRVDPTKAIPPEVRREGGADLERWKALETRIDWARAHLMHAIRTMDESVEFGIVAYNHGIHPLFSGRLVRATPENKESALTRVASLSPSGDTNLYDALLRTLRIPDGKNLYGGNIVDGPSTVYFMTDGQATEGKIQDGHRIAEEILRIDLTRRIRFNCVGIGEHDAVLLRDLASGSGGRYQPMQ